jgi:hypothetical protein
LIAKPLPFLFEDDKALGCCGVKSFSKTLSEPVKKMPTDSLKNDDLRYHFFEYK